ncbi:MULTISPECIES: type II secretion system F family protein [Bacillaceae]|uniref:type II secretion system F family protein n=1 Tax=Bacillaceae TaxID=186817 RepID=UPI00296409C0|nr:type II secretion system F family protein [Bacillus infantis]MDW2879568.1 type II secretion system F family protein [Bacillus infantis]
MDSLILITVILCWLTLALGLVNLYQFAKRKEGLKFHMDEIAAASSFQASRKITAAEKVIAFLARYADDFSTIGERVNLLSESSEIQVLLKKAGNPFDMTVGRFQGFKIVCVIIGFLGGLFSVLLGLPLANIAFVSLPILGFFVPIILVRSKAKKRQQQLRSDLPDFLDTVSVSLQAGSNMDSALKEVIKYFSGPIREEFALFLQEIDLGVPREKAYGGLLERNDNEEFQSFIKSLIQATRLGVPMASTLKSQAEDIRKISLEQIKEQAAKASPKVTMITSFIIAPLIMLLIIGLVLLNMVYGEDSLLRFFTS